MQTVNQSQAQALATIHSPMLLKGILKVLADMHCKDMREDEREKYMTELSDDMNAFQKTIMEAAVKP